jgi:hypothetical protein
MLPAVVELYVEGEIVVTDKKIVDVSNMVIIVRSILRKSKLRKTGSCDGRRLGNAYYKLIGSPPA